MLEEFISIQRDEIIRRCRAKVAARSTPPATTSEIDHGVPMFLGQVIDALHRGLSSSPEIASSALQHGHELLEQGFRVLNGCLDNAIASAVTEFGREKEQPPDDSTAGRKDEHRPLSTQILRNLIHTALVAFEAVKAGTVGIGGSTGTVVHKSLVGALDLMDRSLVTDERLAPGVKKGR
jgi:hypothetical protein